MKIYKSLLILSVSALALWFVLVAVATDGVLQIQGGNAVVGTLPASSLPSGVITNADTRPWTNNGGGLLITNAGVQIGGASAPTSGLSVSNSTAAAGVSIGTNGTLRTSGAITAGSGGLVTISGYDVESGGGLHFTGLGYLYPRADGVFTLQNNAGNAFNRLQFGAQTAAYSAIVATNTSGLAFKDATGASFTNVFFQMMAQPTNYIAANFTPIPGMATYPNSNGVLYKVTQVSTNLVSGL